MTGYSKIRIIGSKDSESRPLDFSDLSPSPEHIKPSTDTSLKAQETSRQIDNARNTRNTNAVPVRDSRSDAEEDQEESSEERFGAKLKRNSSLSSAYALQSAVKSAFSMGRSSSVSESYCRIHDQSMALASPTYGEDGNSDTMGRTRSAKKKSSGGRILKACKKLFRL